MRAPVVSQGALLPGTIPRTRLFTRHHSRGTRSFQKKSTHGIATSQRDIDLIRQRLAVAERDFRERQSGRWKVTPAGTSGRALSIATGS